MSIILFPFKILALVFGGLGKGFGLLIAAICNAFIVRWLLCAYAWNAGDAHITSNVLLVGMIAGFVLTFIAGSSK